MLDENELLFDELYEKTKDCGRVQFINLLMAKEREIKELKEQLEKKYEKVGTLTGYLLYEENTKLINQQKEFIDWLEEKIKETEDKLDKYNELARRGKETDIEYYESIIDERVFDGYWKALKKYKEIVGGNNDQ